jgi:hypothetical protein
VGSVCVPRREISISEGCRLNSVTYAERTRVIRQPTAFFYSAEERFFIAKI